MKSKNYLPFHICCFAFTVLGTAFVCVMAVLDEYWRVSLPFVAFASLISVFVMKNILIQRRQQHDLREMHEQLAQQVKAAKSNTGRGGVPVRPAQMREMRQMKNGLL